MVEDALDLNSTSRVSDRSVHNTAESEAAALVNENITIGNAAKIQHTATKNRRATYESSLRKVGPDSEMFGCTSAETNPRTVAIRLVAYDVAGSLNGRT
jgi:hypothetical protein